jgi:superfamily II DNA/RNA helicase
MMTYHDRRHSMIATPGRLLHHLLEVEMSLKSVQYVVFDEADRYHFIDIYINIKI